MAAALIETGYVSEAQALLRRIDESDPRIAWLRADPLLRATDRVRPRVDAGAGERDPPAARARSTGVSRGGATRPSGVTRGSAASDALVHRPECDGARGLLLRRRPTAVRSRSSDASRSRRVDRPTRTVPFVEPFAWTRPARRTTRIPGCSRRHTTLSARGRALGASRLSRLVGPRERGRRRRSRAGGALAAKPGGDHGGVQPHRRVRSSSGFLRPQAVLLITIPLIWAGAYQLSQGRGAAAAALLIFLASATTANSHLFFPLTLAPIALLWVYPGASWREQVVGVASVLVGWVASPYALHWPASSPTNSAPTF